MKLKLEHIDNLRRWKKSGARVGSRWTPHHLFQFEEILYKKALKDKYLTISIDNRVNLKNLWNKVCIAKKWKECILEKDIKNNLWSIYVWKSLIETGDLKNMKKKILSYI
jgi:hypothetical protein